MVTLLCRRCGNEFGLSLTACPHCGQANFPNVSEAEAPEECLALEQRYQAAVANAKMRLCESVVQTFEHAVAGSKAVINRSLVDVDRLASSDQELYSTYYQQLDAETRFPSGEKWDKLRGVADETLFGPGKKNIRFAALSLDEKGVAHYGECSMVMRESMIAHRASVFEENSILFMEHHNIRVADTDNLPRGFRAPWAFRAKLCVAKLAQELEPNTNADHFPAILMSQGAMGEDASFVEVHVWGPVTIKTFERVSVSQLKKRPGRDAILRKLRQQLPKFNVTLEVA